MTCSLGLCQVKEQWMQSSWRDSYKRNSGKSGGEIVKTGRWPCAVYGKGVGANSIQCSNCCG